MCSKENFKRNEIRPALQRAKEKVMAEELKDLIQKIQKEGVEAAESKSRTIIEEARQKADIIIKDAKKQADSIVSDAKENVAKMEEASRASLKQAGRDLLLSVRTQINDMLAKLVAGQVKAALSVDEVARILGQLIKDAADTEKEQLQLTLKKEDLDKLEKGFLDELKKRVQKGIELKASDSIQGGFTISFDSGKSLFDFTDKALAEYICSAIRPKLAEILTGGNKG